MIGTSKHGIEQSRFLRGRFASGENAPVYWGGDEWARYELPSGWKCLIILTVTMSSKLNSAVVS